MGQWARMAPTRRRTKPRISTPLGRLPDRSRTLTRRTLAIEHNDWLQAVIVMVGIEQTKLLTAVHPVERIVDIEHNMLRHRPGGAAVLVNQNPAEAQQGPPIGQVF